LRLGQILNNLLANAVKFTAHGEVGLSVGVPPGKGTSEVEIEIAVADTGTGISEEDQRLLFQPFQQLDGSVTRTYGGTGLGLAISRQLATLMGGSIR
jgi:signal transduction histidine kinase